MALFVEGIILCVVFTLCVVTPILINPISMMYNYPLPIHQRAKDLGIIDDSKIAVSKKVIAKKAIAAIIIGLIYSYILWNIVNFYYAIVIDCVWFCHSKKVIIPKTEKMKKYTY